MNLPIIQSIFNGALRPNLFIVETTIDGEKREFPCSQQEVYELAHENNFLAAIYGGVDENGTPTIVPLSCNPPDEEIPYRQLAQNFANLPDKLEEIETLCIKELSDYVVFDFDKERPICIEDIAPDNYTPIHSFFYPVNIEISNSNISNPFDKFYCNIIKAEIVRVKLSLFKFAEVSKSDIDTKGAVVDTLKQIRHYAKKATNLYGEMTFFSMGPIKRITAKEIQQKQQQYTIFTALKEYLINFYFEIVITFQNILNKSDFVPFDEFIFECYGRYPNDIENKVYQKAMHIHQAQQLYNNFDSAAASNLLTQLYSDLEQTPTDTTLIAVICALENAIFLQHAQQPMPTFEQLINENYTKSIFRDTKTDINAQILPLTNPREVQFKLEEIRGEQEILQTGSIKINSIPRLINEWLQKQLQICENNITQSFIPIATSTKASTNIKAKQPKTAISQLKTKAHKRLDFLSGYNLHDEKIMSDEDYIRLLSYVDYFITSGQIPPNVTAINTYTTIEYLRYTFYLIYKDLSLKNPTRTEWIALLHTVFSQFGNTVTDSTYKNFSVKPDLYDSDTKTIIKNKR